MNRDRRSDSNSSRSALVQGKRLEVTFIDVGWGDSILIEARDDTENASFALVDCNDSANYPSSLTYLKRHFERLRIPATKYPLFDLVFVTHAHADHCQGIEGILRRFGATNLCSSVCGQANNPKFANLLRWSRTATSKNRPVLQTHRYLVENDSMYLGPVRVDVLWPPRVGAGPWGSGPYSPNENNNSLVLALSLDKVTFVLTGDCSADNWVPNNAGQAVQLPASTRLVQIPHHGARNGVFDQNGGLPLLQELTARNQNRPKKQQIIAAISCHIRPHNHPNIQVISALDNNHITHYRTDRDCRATIKTNGVDVEVQYSHV
jgi:beta-lactamase superfamily II metal-dependent hydrolase